MYGLLKGNREIIRICSTERFRTNSIMISAFASEISRSTRLQRYTKLVENEIFLTDYALEHVIAVKNLDINDKQLVENVALCLDALRLVHVVFNKILYLRSQAFDLSENGDHSLLMDILWINLVTVGESTQQFNSQLTDSTTRDWKLLGFQSNEPTTDFRGMGILGLHQLVYFTTKRPASAFKILTGSKKSVGYFPFAVTGINITQFVLSLLAEARLHQTFFSKYESIVFSVMTNHSNDNFSLQFNRASYNDICVDKACDILHEIYCDIYEEFYSLWMERNPVDIMSFPLIFDELKEIIRGKYLPL
mmetsp:Transcript_28985/g.39813  ORF Transcript_28985/g.39813 Transcript_28985/m.39813 type:complete len:306 (+) Transcript_28985:22-939(+)